MRSAVWRQDGWLPGAAPRRAVRPWVIRWSLPLRGWLQTSTCSSPSTADLLMASGWPVSSGSSPISPREGATWLSPWLRPTPLTRCSTGSEPTARHRSASWRCGPSAASTYESSLHIFHAISRRYWLQEFWTFNLFALLRELLILGPITVLAAYFRRKP